MTQGTFFHRTSLAIRIDCILMTNPAAGYETHGYFLAHSPALRTCGNLLVALCSLPLAIMCRVMAGSTITPNYAMSSSGCLPNNFYIHRYVNGARHETQNISTI